MSLAQLHECCGRDGTFEVQMKFRLGKAANKGFDVGHSLSLVGEMGAFLALDYVPDASVMVMPSLEKGREFSISPGRRRSCR